MGRIQTLILLSLGLISCNSQCDNNVANTPKERDRRHQFYEITVVSYNVEWLYNYDGDCPGLKQLTDNIKQGQPIWSAIPEIPSEGLDWEVSSDKETIKTLIDKHYEVKSCNTSSI